MKIKAVGLNARFTHSCLALFYVRNELEKWLPDAVVEICQYTINDPYYPTLQRMAAGDPDYLFLSTAIWNSDLAGDLIADVLVVSAACRVVIGGPQADVVGSRFAASARVTVFAGNIEAAGPDFYDDLQAGTLQKRYCASFLRSRQRRLDYPYRPEDFSGPLQNRHIYYESSRGCPFACTYCLSSAETGIFHKDLDQVTDELSRILMHRPAVLRFLDRTFNDKCERALAIWRYLADHGGETLFHFEIAPDRFSEEMFTFLEGIEPGRFQFEIGIQSTNGQTLEAIRRPIDPGAAGRVMRRLRRRENIHLHADLILGLPYETKESYLRSFDDIFAMTPHYIQMGLLKVLPDTPLIRTAGQQGYRVSQKPPYSVLANRWMDAATVRELHWLGECVEKCVNNRFFPSLWRYLGATEPDMALFFLELSRSFLDKGYFWMAATQETLSLLLLDQARRRADFPLIKELLCYDWLRCGHRFLPEHLSAAGPSIDAVRRALFEQLPAEIEPLYQRKERSHFIKKGVFRSFSRETLGQIGYEVRSAGAVICFLPEREPSVHRLHRAPVVLHET